MANRKSGNGSSNSHEVHITARMPRELAEELRTLALREDRSLSAEVRRALRLYVDREKAAA